PRQAVRVRRAAGAAARARATWPGVAPCRAVGGIAAPRSGRPAGVARRRRDRADRPRVRTARGVHAPAGRGAVTLPAARVRFGQLLRANGSVAASSANVRGRVLVSPAELRRAPAFVEHSGVPGLDGWLRMRVVPSGREFVVAGTSLGERDDSLRTLALLLAGG